MKECTRVTDDKCLDAEKKLRHATPMQQILDMGLQTNYKLQTIYVL